MTLLGGPSCSLASVLCICNVVLVVQRPRRAHLVLLPPRRAPSELAPIRSRVAPSELLIGFPAHTL